MFSIDRNEYGQSLEFPQANVAKIGLLGFLSVPKLFRGKGSVIVVLGTNLRMKKMIPKEMNVISINVLRQCFYLLIIVQVPSTAMN